jgi:CubicO group peptidase (beta-lactamase class C family)
MRLITTIIILLAGISTLFAQKMININDTIQVFLTEFAEKNKIPGIALIIVQDTNVSYYLYGYRDITSEEPINENTIFELGSNSKAFTAFGVMLLKQNNLIALNEPINKYIHGLRFKFKDEHYSPAIINFLHHTSGIGNSTIGYIPQTNGVKALKETVDKISSIKLAYKPNTKYEYATVNYDILGLLIEKITVDTYEKFMRDSVFLPLNLLNTGITDFEKENSLNKSKGYKVSFFKARTYYPPPFKGNAPAGYVEAAVKDVALWIKHNLFVSTCLPLKYKSALNTIQKPDSAFSNYGMGWFKNENQNRLNHSGANPNYSSYIILDHNSKIGIAVLANIKHDALLGNFPNDVYQLLIQGHVTKKKYYDTNQKLDRIFSTIVIIEICLITLLVIFLVLFFLGKIKLSIFSSLTQSYIFYGLILSIAGIVFFAFKIPSLLDYNYPFNFIQVWAPQSFILAIILVPFMSLFAIFTLIIIRKHIKHKYNV